MFIKKLIAKYNHPQTLIMVSVYPKKGEVYSAGTSGVASYAKNLARSLDRKVVVLADFNDKPSVYEEDNILVIRCFRKNRALMWLSILFYILKFGDTKTILVQFDFAIYGGVLTTSLVIGFLGLLRLGGYKTRVVMHHVVTDALKLSGHLGINDNFLGKIKGFVYNFVFRLFYRLLGMSSGKIIVLEESLKKNLATIIPSGKLTSIPHGVDSDLVAIPKDKARKNLGISQKDYVVLFFGFINWFKGADFFVQTYGGINKLLGKKTRFILAGGKSPTMKDKSFYQKYFSQVLEKIYESKNITITGYVAQRQIKNYFGAADLVVFPYRHLMTASGVLSLVFSYKKPFIISRQLSEMFCSADFINTLKIAGLIKEDLVFDLEEKSCLAVTQKILGNGLKPKMMQLARIMREKRAYQQTGWLWDQTLFNTNLNFKHSPVLGYSR